MEGRRLPDAAERERQCADRLSLEGVARVFDAALAARGARLRFDLDGLEDPAFARALAALYPEAKPVDALPSIFDAQLPG